jgi:Flp pilus assembly protein CpaB
MTRERRFAIAAVVFALLAALLTYRAASASDNQTGRLIPVVVAGEALKPGHALSEADAARFGQRQLPADAAPPDALSDPLDAIGRRPAIELPPGSLLTEAMFIGSGETGAKFRLRGGERALSLDVVVSPAGEQLVAGARVDLFASGLGGDQHTRALIAGAEVLRVQEGRNEAHPTITVRLATAQVASAIRADVFARELRAVLLPSRQS